MYIVDYEAVQAAEGNKLYRLVSKSTFFFSHLLVKVDGSVKSPVSRYKFVMSMQNLINDKG